MAGWGCTQSSHARRLAAMLSDADTGKEAAETPKQAFGIFGN
jgi:hypothetical protein